MKIAVGDKNKVLINQVNNAKQTFSVPAAL